MPTYRSKTSTQGRNMAGARALWRATGMQTEDFEKPIIAVANSFTQFVPGHVHLKDLGQLVCREIEAAGGVAKEFNTIAGKTKLSEHKLDLVDAMVVAADSRISDEVVAEYERSACPTCGSCSGMFTANSMNCLTEAIGLALPGNGTVLATHFDRKDLFLTAARTIVSITRRYYEQNDESVLPRSIASFQAFENAMMLDIAMGGSTNNLSSMMLCLIIKPSL